MTSYKILVVDDEYSHVENVIDYCGLQGWTAKGASNPFEAQDLLAHERFDLMVLDVTMPGKDGMTYCEELRSHGIALPILMCTANQDVDDRVRGLMSGADDYLTKPFSLKELGARIEAILRRANPDRLQVGDLEFDRRRLQVTRAGVAITLKPIALKILNELMSHSPGVVRRERLEVAIWGGEPPDSDSLRANLYLLRQAVDKPFEKKLIHTHPGIGWSISADENE